MGISTPSNASTIDRIRQIHGSAVANEIIEFSVSDERWGFEASGWTSNANYHVKKTTILLFINHRSVESSAIKKALEQTYSTFLPKGGHPFVYLSLNIDPQRVDVNVHPTKREVNFLNEDEIIESICDTIRTNLSQVDTSRTFMTQSLLPGTSKIPLTNPVEPRRTTSQKLPSSLAPTTLIRTDSKLRKITSMLPPSTDNPTGNSSQNPTTYIHTPRLPTTCRLTTIKELRAAVRTAMHATLTSTLASHTYIGLVDPRRRIAAIQSGVKLLLVDYGLLCNEYFYQIGLTDFGNFGSIRFEPPLDIRGLIAIGVEAERVANPEEGIEWEEVAELVTRRLVERREMLGEYFSLNVSEKGELEGIPLLMKGYSPSLAKLPRFLMRLGPFIDWDDEKECFASFLRELAAFYTPEQLPTEDAVVGDDGDRDCEGAGEIRARREELGRVLEDVIFPALGARLVATKGLLAGVVEVADLKGLYRIFERC